MAKIKTVGPLEINATGAIEINSSAGNLNIGNNADAQDINIGTAGTRLIKVGNLSSSTDIALEIGTDDFTLTSATGLLINQLSTGEQTRPLLPAFFARLASDDNNVTGDGTTYTIGTNVSLTTVFDQGSDFSGGTTFTAPILGRYELTLGILVGDTSSANTNANNSIITSNRSFVFIYMPANIRTVSDEVGTNFSVLADLDAADTVTFDVRVQSGTLIVDLLASSPSGSTFAAGALVC